MSHIETLSITAADAHTFLGQNGHPALPDIHLPVTVDDTEWHPVTVGGLEVSYPHQGAARLVLAAVVRNPANWPMDPDALAYESPAIVVGATWFRRVAKDQLWEDVQGMSRSGVSGLTVGYASRLMVPVAGMTHTRGVQGDCWRQGETGPALRGSSLLHGDMPDTARLLHASEAVYTQPQGIGKLALWRMVRDGKRRLSETSTLNEQLDL